MNKVVRRVLAGIGAVLLVGLALLALLETGVPLGGVSRSDAVAAATRQAKAASSTPPQVQWAVPGLFGWFGGGAGDSVARWNRPVWAVRLTGTFRGSCGPAPTLDEPLRCPGPDHTETVILDYRSGEFIMASIEP